MSVRELLILRHGKSLRDPSIPTDYERGLKDRGIRDSARVGEHLVSTGWHPDRVISSTAERAITTARLVCDVLGISEDRIHQERQLYLAHPDTVASTIAAVAEDTDRAVMVVGHNPGLTTLAEDFIGSIPWDYIPTCGAVRIAFPEIASWQELPGAHGTLLELIRPREL
jgi:phosphohistidine phosphatase